MTIIPGTKADYGELNPCDRLNQPTKRSGVKIIPKNVLDGDVTVDVTDRNGINTRHWLRITP